MANFRTAVFGITLAALAGCNGTLTPVSSDESLPGYFTVNSTAHLFHGSAVQWNQHYAISAGHIPLLSNVVHRCSTGCDLVFIRHEARGTVPAWRPAVVGETLETVGQSPLLVTVKGSGTSKAIQVRLNRKGDDTAYALSDAPVAKGMSGGPVYGKDDAVVGMTIGIFQPNTPLPAALKNSRSLSVYIPYQVIQREWELFMEGQAAASRGPVHTRNPASES
ncbi:serine protease [Pseudomonas citronellolis]|uniref:serine protease n=1 Tax=Pseudomonas citronellolis TaxID=53408 RepID=UPI00248E4543|nr:serine protease [Pseudomonas citronellolis]